MCSSRVSGNSSLPLANWIWIGALVMDGGGTISLTDRRYRVGAPARRAARAGAVPAE